MSDGARFGDDVLQKDVFDKVGLVHGIAVNEVTEPVMLGSVCRIACVEGALCVAGMAPTL